MATGRKTSRYGHRDATMILLAVVPGTDCGLPRSVTCNGIRLSWPPVACMCGAANGVRRACIPFRVMNSALYAALQREQPPGPYVFCSERGEYNDG